MDAAALTDYAGVQVGGQLAGPRDTPGPAAPSMIAGLHGPLRIEVDHGAM